MAAKPIFVQAVDTNGAPYSGAKLNVYDAGTTTPRAIYTESGLGTASANPAIADANGVVVVWVNDAGGDIKVTLTNSAETVTPHNEDNVPIASLTCYPVITFQGDQSLLTTSSPTFAGLTLGNVSFAGVVTDPNADRLVFWDDSAGQVNFMTLGTGLAFAGTALELDGDLQDISGLTPTDGGVIIGDGTDFVVESGATLRASLGVAIGSDVLAHDDNLQAFVDAFTAPTSDGAAGQVVTTDGAGNLTFATPAGAGDLLGAANETITGNWTFNGSLTLNGTIAGTSFLDEDDLTSDSATKLASQQSIKAYNDNQRVANYTALKALSAGLYSSVYVEDTARGGHFVWQSGDQSALVTGDPSEGVIVPPSSDVTGASGVWRRRVDGDCYDIRWFGVVADGSTNDDSTIGAAITYCEANDVWLDFGGHAVRLDTPFTRTIAGNVKWVDPSFDISNHNPTGVVNFMEINSALDNDSGSGDWNLTGNAAGGSNTVTVTDATGLAAGDTILISDDTAAVSSGNTGKQSQWTTIESIASNTLTLTTPVLVSSFTTAANAQVRKVNTDHRFQVRGELKIVGNDLNSGTNAQNGLVLNLLYEPDIDRFDCHHTEGNGLIIQDCIRPRVGDVRARECDFVGQGYGVSVSGSWNAKIGVIQAISCRHAFSSTVSTSNGEICGRGLHIESVMASDCTGAGFDTHVAYFDVYVGSCVVDYRNSVTTQEGISLEAPRTTIGKLSLNGAYDNGLIINNLGSTDVLPDFVRIGLASIYCDTNDTDYNIYIQNNASVSGRAFTVDFGTLSLKGDLGIRAKAFGSAGDVHLNIGMANIETADTMFLMESTSSSRVFVTVNSGMLKDTSASSSVVIMEGNAYHTANSNPGCYFKMNAGVLSKNAGSGSIIDNDDGYVYLEGGVVIDNPNSATLHTATGIGELFQRGKYSTVESNDQGFFGNTAATLADAKAWPGSATVIVGADDATQLWLMNSGYAQRWQLGVVEGSGGDLRITDLNGSAADVDLVNADLKHGGTKVLGAQQSGTGETVGFTAGSGTAVNDDSTFTGNVGSTAYRISDIVKALKNHGLIAS
jgi:hypothetical protein